MRLFDRYVIRQFLLTTFFALAAFTVIFVVIDMMENLDDFLDRHAGIGIIATYYFYFIPEILKLMTPVALLLAALFTTGRLTKYNELTALKSGGVSLYRFLVPLAAIAMIISLASVYFTGWVVPAANKQKLSIARVYFQKNIEFVAKNNIFIQDSPTRILSIGVYDDYRNTATQVSVQDFAPGDPTTVIGRYDAARMQWDPISKSWTLINGIERRFAGGTETAETFTTRNIGPLNFSPEDIRKKQQRPEEMDYPELKAFILSLQRAGQDASRWLVDYYSRVSFPFASVIVVLFGVPFASVKRRSGPGIEFGIAIAVTFLYMVCLQISQAFGSNGDIHPLLTAWMANFIFLAAAIYNIIRVQK